MAPPSPLAIATKAVERLVKEETYYRTELVKQEERVRKLAQEIKDSKPEDLDDNAEFVLKQETRAVDETLAVFGPLKQKTEGALSTLEEQIALKESDATEADKEELEKARAVLRTGQIAVAKDQ